MSVWIGSCQEILEFWSMFMTSGFPLDLKCIPRRRAELQEEHLAAVMCGS